MSETLYSVIFFLVGGAVCLLGSRLWSVSSKQSLGSSPAQSTEPPDQFQSALEAILGRLDGLETGLAEIKAQRRQLELEWDDHAQRFRSILGRLDKHAGRQAAKLEATAETAQELTDAELASRFFNKNSRAVG